MSSYLYLGQVKRGIDRGVLLNQALSRVHEAPNKDRKGKVLEGLEVAEVVTIMGLTDAVKSLFLLNRELYEQDTEQGKAAIRRGLYELLSQQLQRAGHTVAATAPIAPQAPVERSVPPSEPLARPVAPSPQPPPEAAPASPARAAPAPTPEKAPTGGKSPLSGLMTLR
ncbi:hypothetical protein [Marinimicrobium sp. ABcell2]|uniref:hypothetical protein n=1 Tax=Marinimicrobium sp. ABcell2 TaxID=3069751 RepID=UPI0027AE8532|nr:hypothetical protein [Marinimicrobium sp. ABcell2]MDQ2077520.1 hypothetical protein [Marinimicrobium sp. ABcell2]